jgi:hypothetical protein
MINLKISVADFRKFVGDTVFTAVFKKQDGSIRRMNARLNVKAYVKGTAPEATAKRKQTLTAQNMVGVFEMATEQFDENGKRKAGAEKYRTLNLDTLLELHAGGKTWRVEEV